MDWGWAMALYFYVVGCGMQFMASIYTMDDDPWWHRVYFVLAWPIMFPIAMICGRD